MGYHIWKQEEIEFVKKYYPLKGARYVCNSLNITKASCYYKARKLGLKHEIIYWTKEQKNFLVKYYPTKGAIWVAERVNHSSACCRYMAGRLNIKFIKTNEWKSEEIEIVRKYYPILGKFVTNLLPNRSISSCLYMANKLGVTYKKKDSSTIEQIKKILEQKQISYKQEVGFKECIDKGMLLFDIAIYDDDEKNTIIGLIEYDGTQHFFQTTAYQDKNISAETVFKNTQRRDQIKNGFCREFQIPLLRIRYDQRNLEELITLFLNNLKGFTNWYNPYLSYDEYYNNEVDEEFKQHYIHFFKIQKRYQT